MSDETVGLTATDCTPRARRGESAEALAARIGGYARSLEYERQHVALVNRNEALRTSSDGLHYTRCACGWTGLRVADPEIARREYDVHQCRMTGEIGVRLHRADPLPAGWAEATKAQIEETMNLLREPQREAMERVRDEFEARVQNLEMK